MSDYFKALHIQEESLTSLREIWEKTGIDEIELLLDIIQQEPEDFRECVKKLPISWVEFIRDCTVVGLRQAVLEIHEEPDSEL